MANKAIEKFNNEYHFLSNFYPSQVILDEEIYPTVEHAYQAAKTTDPIVRAKIRVAVSANSAKSLGKRIKNLREDWDTYRLTLMWDLLNQKFYVGGPLTQQLLDTGTLKLVEGNWWGDIFWGVYKGVGDNHLGKMLMKIRKARSGT